MPQNSCQGVSGTRHATGTFREQFKRAHPARIVTRVQARADIDMAASMVYATAGYRLRWTPNYLRQGRDGQTAAGLRGLHHSEASVQRLSIFVVALQRFWRRLCAGPEERCCAAPAHRSFKKATFPKIHMWPFWPPWGCGCEPTTTTTAAHARTIHAHCTCNAARAVWTSSVQIALA